MSLIEFSVPRDRFKLDEKTEIIFSFPCCNCAHRIKDQNEEPCRSCDHNINADPKEARDDA